MDENLERAHEIILAAGGEHSDVVVFPELFLTGYSLGRVDKDVALSTDDPRLLALGGIAPETDVLIGLYEDGLGVHNYNSAAYYDAEKLVHTHRKLLYLPTYDIYEERKFFSPGQTLRAFDTRQGRVATLICNDAWQPHLAFLAVQDGARVLFVPTNSSQSRFPEQYDSSGATSRSSTRACTSASSCSSTASAMRPSTCASGAGRTSSIRGERS